MKNDAPVFIAGHGDVVEVSLVSYFRAQGFSRVLSSSEHALSLLDRSAVDAFFRKEKPLYVILGSVRSGGIGANQAFPAEFIYDNMVAEANVIDAAYRNGVAKLLFLGASCVYPKECAQPMREEYILTGAMEKTSAPYSTAKAAGIVMCQAYRAQYGFNAIAAVPATVYGPGGHEDQADAHVLAAMAAKFREALRTGAPSITLWGTGKPCREFIYSQDLADACLFLLRHYDEAAVINVGTGTDVAVMDLALLLKEVSGYTGELIWDTSKPDGALRKLLDSSRLSALGWSAKTALKDGVRALWQCTA